MKTHLTKLFAAALGLTLGASTASAQQDPTRIGAGQLPFVLVILDTSGSTEWTDKGDERYPEYPANEEWVPGTPMEINPSSPSAGPSRFGSCFVWEPSSCSNYQRPGWRISSDVPQWGHSLINSGGQGHLKDRWDAMKGSTYTNGIRLSPQSQPRHVTLKEVLTGDMVLWSDQHRTENNFPLAASLNPGCWFVPRHRGASIQPEDEQKYCLGENKFEKLPDFDEPRPHFQEVFDAQLANGLIDNLGTSAIFAVGLLDGYKDKMSDWQNDLNDNISGSAPSSSTGARSAGTEDDGSHYNLGLYQIVGPKKLDIPAQFMGEIARHVQVAMVDAGYVHRSTDAAWKISLKEKKGKGGGSIAGRPELGLNYTTGAADYLDDHILAKQPIARATPLAAATMDARQFFKTDSRFTNDRYKECRSKHVVLVTDGFPEPEMPGAGSNLGNEALSPVFGYTDLTKYNYANTETEIKDLVFDSPSDYKYQSRVYVVALDNGSDATTRTRVAQKMSTMAIEGNTCASDLLGPDWMPAPDGTCDPAVRACLASGQYSYNSYVPPDSEDGAAIACKYPALVLTRNDRDSIQIALATVFGGIIGGAGVASRTRAVVSDFLDDDGLPGGGQYRIYSGSRIQGSAYWRGILTRETLPCDDDANSFSEGAGVGALEARALHADVGQQVDCGPVADGDCSLQKRDNRRIFTSIPNRFTWGYNNSVAGNPITQGVVNPMYSFRFGLAAVPQTADEFRGTTIPNVANPGKLVGTRIPLYDTEIFTALQTEVTAANATVWSADGLLEYFGLVDNAEAQNMFNVHRGRVLAKATGDRETSRVITGILNSTPAIVPPPIRDLPIESYREYRARYGDRPTMMYAATMDGQLHGIHVGELEGRIAVRNKVANNAWAAGDDAVVVGAGASPSTSGAPHQREAWAYIPNMVLRQLAGNSISQPYLMDGSPVVKDVRLCQRIPENNQNEQACNVIRDNSSGDPNLYLKGDQQWRTVLVQSLGQAGAGYFAMDVTRSGGIRAGEVSRVVDRPDPVVLWELNPDWEGGQFKALLADSQQARYRPTTAATPAGFDINLSGCDNIEQFWAQSMMGLSVSQPEIATAVVKYGPDANPNVQQRPIAVFGAGLPDGSTLCNVAVSGAAVYVVDLQTGTILRRFVEADFGATPRLFVNEGAYFTGSPALYDSNTGSVATRGYIGDSQGRLYKIDLTDPRPENWKMTLALDPKTHPQIGPDMTATGLANIGPASGKPSIAIGPERQLVVTYGLGEVGDVTTADQVQAVITISEFGNTFPVNWYKVFPEGEKMTGDPVVFNRAVYFPTYALPDADVCKPGAARIYGIQYFNATAGAPQGVFTDSQDADFKDNDEINLDPNGLYFEVPETLIRGLTVTLGPICTGIPDASGEFDDSRGAMAQPQLIAQTGAKSGGQMSNTANAGAGNDSISRITKNLERRRGPVVPLNWGVIN